MRDCVFVIKKANGPFKIRAENSMHIIITSHGSSTFTSDDGKWITFG